jgi:predicted acyltransferase (DUF342 family)
MLQPLALCQSTYSGGDISLGAQSTVYGNVIAGNLLNTSGDSTIVGSLSAAGLGDTKKDLNLQVQQRLIYLV